MRIYSEYILNHSDLVRWRGSEWLRE